MINIAIFASGAGSNAQKIIELYQTDLRKNQAKIALIVCNKPTAGVLKIAETHRIPTLLIEKTGFNSQNSIISALSEYTIDFIVLAGFLWKIPQALIDAYPQKIVNIHPALLPKYGGKGMYGAHVHEAVIANKEKESGITIHWVDEHYDHGDTLFQASCKIDDTETPKSLAQKIHALEHEHFPRVVAELVENL